MIRDARFADIPQIVLLLREMYLRTHYAAEGSSEIDVEETKRLLVTAIRRHGGEAGGSTWCQVAEENGSVSGLIIGTLARPYGIGTGLMATDLMWAANDQASPFDAVKLMKGFIAWAKSVPSVIEIRCGATAIIQDPETAGRILETLGLKQYGNLYRCRVEGQTK